MAQINWSEDIQNFFNNDLAKMVVNLFKFPATCLKKINEDCKVKTIVAPLMMLVLCYIVSTLMFLLMKVPFGYAAQMALMLVFFVIFLCGLSFVVLAIKGKSDINLALNSTTPHMLIFTIFLVVLALIVLILGEGPWTLLKIGDDFWGIVIILVVVYGVALGISCVRQLLMNNIEDEGKETYAWWLSPCVVVLSLVLAIFISNQL